MQKLLTELFRKYYRDIYAYLYSMTADASLSEDLTSEVFLEVVNSISTFRGESDIKTWMFAIARRRWYACLRKKNGRPETKSIEELCGTGIPDPQTETYRDAAAIAASVLDKESTLTGNVFRLRMEGYTYFEIAEKLGISESSARVVFFRVKEKIRKELEKEGYSK